MDIEIDEFILNDLKNEIKFFLKNEYDIEIGEIGTDNMVEFLNETIGPYYYNQGVKDAHDFLFNRLEDLKALEKNL